MSDSKPTDGAERPETDDYDLLTFGEVSARLRELLSSERAALERLRGQPSPNDEKVRRLEERIELLSASADRYRRQQRTNEVYNDRFGGEPPGPAGVV